MILTTTQLSLDLAKPFILFMWIIEKNVKSWLKGPWSTYLAPLLAFERLMSNLYGNGSHDLHNSKNPNNFNIITYINFFIELINKM